VLSLTIFIIAMDLSFLEFPFMQRALVVGGVTGLVCGILGVFVVLRGVAFVGEGISHAAFAGIALGILLGAPPLGIALLFCVAISMLVAYVSRTGGLREDTGSGIFFSSSIALGAVLLSTSKRSAGEVMSYLFGNILTLTSSDITLSLSLSAITLLCVLLLFKELETLVFDEDLALMLGIPVQLFTYILFALIAITVVSSLKVVGIILVSSLLITPAATALQLSRDFDRVVILAGAIGVAVVEVGLAVSYYLDSPPGATIALLSTIVFLFSVLWKNTPRGMRRS